jgi:hypothetical protein
LILSKAFEQNFDGTAVSLSPPQVLIEIKSRFLFMKRLSCLPLAGQNPICPSALFHLGYGNRSLDGLRRYNKQVIRIALLFAWKKG